MADDFRSPASQADDELPEEDLEEGDTQGPVEDQEEDVKGDLDPDREPSSFARPIYGQSAHRHLGREIPVWAIGVAAIAAVVLIIFLFSLIGGGEDVQGTPTPDATAVTVSQEATVTALAMTPTSVPPTATPVPPPEPVLAPGAQAKVVNSEPEGIRMRSGPGRDYRMLQLLKDGAVVELLPQPDDVDAYPVQADGFLWWKVRTEGGQEGWLAEGDEKAPWLQPFSGD